jgi:aerobic carbon-monoxide dehydrogenase medium subunit
MKRFAYLEPRTLQEAVSCLRQHGGTANVLAGGTDLLVEIKEHLRQPEHVINIKKIPGMNHFTYHPQQGLRFGSLVTARQIEIAPEILQNYPGLSRACSDLGSIQVRNRATIAGNVCRASPSADTLPPLIADGASLKIYGPDGERVVLLEDFFTGPGKTILSPDELVTEIAIPAPLPHTGRVYIKHGRRKAMELATVGVAVSLTLDGAACREVRIVLGAVAPTPIRARKAEDLLRGRLIDDKVIDTIGEAAMSESRPISNVRGSAEYRREMVGVLTRRAIKQAMEMAR